MTGSASSGSRSEQPLVVLAAGGDKLAFSELVRRHGSAVRVLLRRMGADRALTDDIAQDAFLTAWRQIGALRDPGAFEAWVKRIAARLYVKRWRALNREEALNVADEPIHSPDLNLPMDLDAALKRLSAAERMCISLCTGAGYTHDEAALALRMPVGTVKSHVRRGLERLRLYLTSEPKEAAHG